MQALLDVILPVFCLIGAGYLLTWRGYFPVAGIEGLMKYAQGFAVPCLLFVSISRLDLNASFHFGHLAAFYSGAFICFWLGLFGARYLAGRDWEDSVAIGFCCLFSNSVLLGLPITERAFGEASLAGSLAIVSFHAPFCYGLGITVMEIIKHRGQPKATMLRATSKAMFSNVLVMAIVAGFVVNLSGLSLPQVATDAMDMVARSALPAALFALGGILVQYRPEGDAKAIAIVCCLALLVHPAIVWTIGYQFNVPNDLFRAGVLTASMAPGFNAYIFANMYGRAKRVAATSVLISTALSLLTSWFWLLTLT
ncbi:MAG: AEC family transporter [Paracoccaceae bacterium]